MLKGIDLSKYQANNYKYYIDNYGDDFVICRAAWRYSVDNSCDTMYQYAKSKGKLLGFYFFPLTSDGEPEKHAEWAYNQVKGYINEAIPFLDWEAYSGMEGVNNIANVNWAKKWMDKFFALSGVKPMIYMNSSCNSMYDFSSIVKADYGLWIANYGTNNGKDNGRPNVKHWSFAAMHQYTSLGDKGKGLDCNTFYGDKAAWKAYAKSNKSEPLPTIPPTPTVKTYTQEEVDKMLKDACNGLKNIIKDYIDKA